MARPIDIEATNLKLTAPGCGDLPVVVGNG